MALRFVRQLYSLDTLDTRFVVPATAPPKEALQEAQLDPRPSPTQNGRNKDKSAGESLRPRLWNTPEFYVYYVVIAASVFMMFKLVLDASRGWSSAMADMGACADHGSLTSKLRQVLALTGRWMDSWP
jgi:hypothetical protein